MELWHMLVLVYQVFFLEFKFVKLKDETTKRPLAGYVVFNEAYLSFDEGNYTAQISNVVHEVLHALYFDPELFKHFPNNSSGESFLFQDSKGVYKMRGDHTLTELRSHFGCSTIDGGIFYDYLLFFMNTQFYNLVLYLLYQLFNIYN